LLNISIATTDNHDLTGDVDINHLFDGLFGRGRRLLGGRKWHGKRCDEQQHSLTVEQVIHDRPRVRPQS
jgi:hypothetical protein